MPRSARTLGSSRTRRHPCRIETWSPRGTSQGPTPLIEDFDTLNPSSASRRVRAEILSETSSYQAPTNERVAQLMTAARPLTAKDKRCLQRRPTRRCHPNTLYQHLLGPWLIFKLTNVELDELLFVYKLHEDAKLHYRRGLKLSFDRLNQEQFGDDVEKRDSRHVCRTSSDALKCRRTHLPQHHGVPIERNPSNQVRWSLQTPSNVVTTMVEITRAEASRCLPYDGPSKSLHLRGNIQNWTRCTEGSTSSK